MNPRHMFCIALLVATLPAQAQVSNTALSVNDQDISRAFLQAQVDAVINGSGMNYGGITQPDAYKQIQDEVVEQLIAQTLLWQEAERRDFIADDAAVDAALEEIRRQYDSPVAFRFKIEEGGFTEATFREDLRHRLSVQGMIAEGIAPSIDIDEQDVERFYADNLAQMRRPPAVRARHILISPASDSEADRAAARTQIEEILADLRNGADFEALAKQFSQGPSAPLGGDLGFFERGQMVLPFEQAAFALEPGTLSEVVETRFGYHVIRVEERRGDDILPFDEVADRIRAHLGNQEIQMAVEGLVARLREQGDIRVFVN